MTKKTESLLQAGLKFFRVFVKAKCAGVFVRFLRSYPIYQDIELSGYNCSLPKSVPGSFFKL